MPRRTAQVCPEPGCPELVFPPARYCEEHTRQRRAAHDARRPNSSERGYDMEWRRIRAAYLAAHPYCEDCGGIGTEVHHKVPLSQGGTHDWENLMTLCKPDHSRRTAKENGGFGNPRREGE